VLRSSFQPLRMIRKKGREKKVKCGSLRAGGEMAINKKKKICCLPAQIIEGKGKKKGGGEVRRSTTLPFPQAKIKGRREKGRDVIR